MTVSGGRPAWSPSPSALPLPSRLDRKKKFVFRAPLNLTGGRGWLIGGYLHVIATFQPLPMVCIFAQHKLNFLFLCALFETPSTL